MTRSVAVFGAAGYAGALSAALVERHPSLSLQSVTARGEDVGRRLSDLYPRYRVGLELEELDLDVHGDVDAAIVAYPHGAAAEVVSELVARGVPVVDLSADFRLRDPAVYAEWYREHPNPELIADAVYGLPELYREQLRDASLVANPGCYPTAAILSLAPLARAGLISDVVIDAKSGVSGAGRAATEKTHFVTVDENLSPYGVPRHRHTPEIEQEISNLLGLDLKLTFTPHLIPLDQGELVSCYVTLPDLDPAHPANKRTISIEQIRELYASAYAREPFVELTDAMPGVRDVRDTNICRISVNHDERTGRVIVFGVIDNLWKGAASQAVQNLNLMLGLPEGFRAAGVAADIKPSGDPDVALLVCDAPGVTSHAMFTRSGTQSAPVLVCRERCELDSIAAIVVNSGNANAATGSGGYDDALEMQRRAAEAAGVAPESVAVASTGVIGVPLPMERVSAGIDAAAAALAPDGDRAFSDAIQTTDAFEKRARVRVALPSGPVTITAQAKGAGMISPNFATLLCFVQTDAALSAETCELLLSVCVKRSFDRISVDGQLSTSDTVILQASGASGVVVEPESEDELRLGEAIDAITRQLALLVVRDGEGARRTGRVIVRGGDERTVQRVARAVANSPLVKAALYGGDPNWGRIAQAAGAAMPDTAPLALDISIEGIQLCSGGSFVPHDAHALAAAVAGDEVEYEIGLAGEGAEAEVYFSDLGHEYVTINAEYTT